MAPGMVRTCVAGLLLAVSCVHAKGPQLKTHCDRDTMVVEVPLPATEGATVYLQHLRDYPDAACHPEVSEGVAVFRLPLRDVFRCGVTRVTQHSTGIKTYIARVSVEAGAGAAAEVATAKCALAPVSVANALNRTRRNVLPAGFQEEEVLEVRPVETTVQAPQLGVAVRQGGQLVSGELNVNPGTPLQMEVTMDEAAARVYGLLVAHMVVSDTRAQEETIIFNGCSVDPYLFDNFETTNGDFLSARFRAFKFPESAFVQFRGTVNVCLDKCRGVECSNGVTGYGRRRRAVAEMPADPNKVFEVAMSAFLKVDYADDEAAAMEKALLGARSDSPVQGEEPGEASDINAIGGRSMGGDGARVAASGREVPREEVPSFTVHDPEDSGAISRSAPVLLLLVTALTALIVC